ncbi:hypothetical protein V5O48_019054, partial [Marasmius crinis-equi]
MLALNSIFFHMVMDERYRDLSLFQMEGNMGLVDFLVHYSSPFITQRVRTLRLRPYFIRQLLEAREAGLVEDDLYNETIYRLEALLGSFTQLRECHIAWYNSDISCGGGTENLLRKALTASTRLRKLSLVLSLPKLGALLAPDTTGLELDLEELEISILPPEDDVVGNQNLSMFEL